MAKKRKAKGGLLICSFPEEGYFERVSTRGRGVGNVIKYRYVVKACKYGWEVGEQYEGSLSCSINARFPGRIKFLPYCFRAVIGDNYDKHPFTRVKILTAINESVSKLLGKKYKLTITEDSSAEDKIKAAEEMDEFYKLDYARVEHEFVQLRLLAGAGMEADDSEDE